MKGAIIRFASGKRKSRFWDGEYFRRGLAGSADILSAFALLSLSIRESDLLPRSHSLRLCGQDVRAPSQTFFAL